MCVACVQGVLAIRIQEMSISHHNELFCLSILLSNLARVAQTRSTFDQNVKKLFMHFMSIIFAAILFISLFLYGRKIRGQSLQKMYIV